jgi:naphthalene 1,2-dioxygenase system ferredoxin subunit
MSEPAWTPTIEAEKVEADGVAGTVVNGKRVALYFVEGEYFATDDFCTHGQALLSEGYLEDYAIECPLHQGTFDVRTGEPTAAPCTVAVKSYPVKVEDGVIHVAMG